MKDSYTDYSKIINDYRPVTEQESETAHRVKGQFPKMLQNFAIGDGENFLSYLKRIRVSMNQIHNFATDKHMLGPKGPWYCHFGFPNCFICDDMQIADLLYDYLYQFASQGDFYLDSKGVLKSRKRKKDVVD